MPQNIKERSRSRSRNGEKRRGYVVETIEGSQVKSVYYLSRDERPRRSHGFMAAIANRDPSELFQERVRGEQNGVHGRLRRRDIQLPRATRGEASNR